MNYTGNYQLSQWEKSDRVLMEDFNANNTKIDDVLVKKIGQSQLISTTSTTISQNVISFHLDNIDWENWESVTLLFTYRATTTSENANYIYCDVNDGSVQAYCSAGSGLLRSQPNPFALVFLSRHNAQGPVYTFCIGDPGGMGIAQCTFSELENIRFHYIKTGDGLGVNFPVGLEILLFGNS